MEQQNTLKALQTAMQMELDGKEYYLKASGQSSNETGRLLLKSLAEEEDAHRHRFQEIFDAIKSKQAWPETDFHPDKGKRLRTILAAVKEKPRGTAAQTELDAISLAQDMEGKTVDFYMQQERVAAYDTEKKYYQSLAGEERAHRQVLDDYYEYLKNPAAWFVNKERHSLDGG